MTNNERSRTFEIIFYKYFENQPSEKLNNPLFWESINAVCKANGVDSLLVSRAVRILNADENKPTEHETWYLCDMLGMSVRQINGFSKIYWQKQNNFREQKAPAIRHRITDPAMRNNLIKFVYAIYEIFGSLKYLNTKMLDTLFDT